MTSICGGQVHKKLAKSPSHTKTKRKITTVPRRLEPLRGLPLAASENVPILVSSPSTPQLNQENHHAPDHHSLHTLPFHKIHTTVSRITSSTSITLPTITPIASPFSQQTASISVRKLTSNERKHLKKQKRGRTVYLPSYVHAKDLSQRLHTTMMQLHKAGTHFFPWWPRASEKQLKKTGYAMLSDLVLRFDESHLLCKYLGYNGIYEHTGIERIRNEHYAMQVYLQKLRQNGEIVTPSVKRNYAKLYVGRGTGPEPTLEEEKPKHIQPKQPVVCIVGHVNHGKTTLLDTLRGTHLAKREDGGITQDLYAYQCDLGEEVADKWNNDENDPTFGKSSVPAIPANKELDSLEQYDDDTLLTMYKKVTFLDTPGHASFFDMRENGALFSDLVVLVVSSVEGVCPQTLESIEYIKAFKLPVVVALTKTDMPQSNPKIVMKQLREAGLNVRMYNEDGAFDQLSPPDEDVPQPRGLRRIQKPRIQITPCIPISAPNGTNIGDFKKTLMKCFMITRPQADIAAPPVGLVLESFMEEGGRGTVMRVLLSSGIIEKNDSFISGLFSGKVKDLRIYGDVTMNEFTVDPKSTQFPNANGNNIFPATSSVGQLAVTEDKEFDITTHKVGIDRKQRKTLINQDKSFGVTNRKPKLGQRVDYAIPGIPLDIVGLDGIANSGDDIRVVPDAMLARTISETRRLELEYTEQGRFQMGGLKVTEWAAPPMLFKKDYQQNPKVLEGFVDEDLVLHPPRNEEQIGQLSDIDTDEEVILNTTKNVKKSKKKAGALVNKKTHFGRYHGPNGEKEDEKGNTDDKDDDNDESGSYSGSDSESNMSETDYSDDEDNSSEESSQNFNKLKKKEKSQKRSQRDDFEENSNGFSDSDYSDESGDYTHSDDVYSDDYVDYSSSNEECDSNTELPPDTIKSQNGQKSYSQRKKEEKEAKKALKMQRKKLKTDFGSDIDSLNVEERAKAKNTINQSKKASFSHNNPDTYGTTSTPDWNRIHELEFEYQRPFVVKGATAGGVKMILDSVAAFNERYPDKKIHLVHAMQGSLNENDLLQASSAVDPEIDPNMNCPVLLYRTRKPSPRVLQKAKKVGIDVYSYAVFDDLLKHMIGTHYYNEMFQDSGNLRSYEAGALFAEEPVESVTIAQGIKRLKGPTPLPSKEESEDDKKIRLAAEAEEEAKRIAFQAQIDAEWEEFQRIKREKQLQQQGEQSSENLQKQTEQQKPNGLTAEKDAKRDSVVDIAGKQQALEEQQASLHAKFAIEQATIEAQFEREHRVAEAALEAALAKLRADKEAKLARIKQDQDAKCVAIQQQHQLLQQQQNLTMKQQGDQQLQEQGNILFEESDALIDNATSPDTTTSQSHDKLNFLKSLETPKYVSPYDVGVPPMPPVEGAVGKFGKLRQLAHVASLYEQQMRERYQKPQDMSTQRKLKLEQEQIAAATVAADAFIPQRKVKAVDYHVNQSVSEDNSYGDDQDYTEHSLTESDSHLYSDFQDYSFGKVSGNGENVIAEPVQQGIQSRTFIPPPPKKVKLSEVELSAQIEQPSPVPEQIFHPNVFTPPPEVPARKRGKVIVDAVAPTETESQQIQHLQPHRSIGLSHFQNSFTDAQQLFHDQENFIRQQEGAKPLSSLSKVKLIDDSKLLNPPPSHPMGQQTIKPDAGTPQEEDAYLAQLRDQVIKGGVIQKLKAQGIDPEVYRAQFKACGIDIDEILQQSPIAPASLSGIGDSKQ